MCVFLFACACVCVLYVCVCVCAFACVRVCVYVRYVCVGVSVFLRITHRLIDIHVDTNAPAGKARASIRYRALTRRWRRRELSSSSPRTCLLRWAFVYACFKYIFIHVFVAHRCVHLCIYDRA